MWDFPFHLASNFGSHENPSLSMKSFAVCSGVPFGRDALSFAPISAGLPISAVECSFSQPAAPKKAANERAASALNSLGRAGQDSRSVSEKSLLVAWQLGLLDFIEGTTSLSKKTPHLVMKGQDFAQIQMLPAGKASVNSAT